MCTILIYPYPSTCIIMINDEGISHISDGAVNMQICIEETAGVDMGDGLVDFGIRKRGGGILLRKK